MKSSAIILEEHKGALVLLVTLADERCMVISIGADGRTSSVLANTGTPVVPLDLPVTPEEDEAFNAMSKRGSGCLSLTIGPQRYT